MDHNPIYERVSNHFTRLSGWISRKPKAHEQFIKDKPHENTAIHKIKRNIVMCHIMNIENSFGLETNGNEIFGFEVLNSSSQTKQIPHDNNVVEIVVL